MNFIMKRGLGALILFTLALSTCLVFAQSKHELSNLEGYWGLSSNNTSEVFSKGGASEERILPNPSVQTLRRGLSFDLNSNEKPTAPTMAVSFCPNMALEHESMSLRSGFCTPEDNLVSLSPKFNELKVIKKAVRPEDSYNYINNPPDIQGLDVVENLLELSADKFSNEIYDPVFIFSKAAEIAIPIPMFSRWGVFFLVFLVFILGLFVCHRRKFFYSSAVSSFALILGLSLMTSGIPASAANPDVITFIHTDTSGNPLAGTDGTGALIWKETYQAYGDRYLKQPSSGQQTQWFHGKVQDPSGLQYFGQRYYDPLVARFMSIDPVDFQEGNLESFNRYAYANNNPVKFLDPDGRAAFLALLPEAGAIVFTRMAIWLGARQMTAVSVAETAAMIGTGAVAPGVAGVEALSAKAVSAGVAKGPGAFMAVSESMSVRAAAYQARVTGANAGSAYVVNGVKFDGFQNGVLLEAKSNYAQFVKNGEFRSWFNGADGFINQAQRQLGAANGVPIQWRFAEESVANATRSLFRKQGISGIEIVHVP